MQKLHTSPLKLSLVVVEFFFFLAFYSIYVLILHRAKSKSTPALEGLHKQDVKGLITFHFDYFYASSFELTIRYNTPPLCLVPLLAAGSGKKKGQLSQAEKERLQILEEMRKKTQLLTDGSWIRQRNASTNKEPITAGTSVKRSH